MNKCYLILLIFDCDVFMQEEDKARLVQETGLQLKQINNWFINQRKRNWHSNPSTSTVLKSKRKRYSFMLKGVISLTQNLHELCLKTNLNFKEAMQMIIVLFIICKWKKTREPFPDYTL